MSAPSERPEARAWSDRLAGLVRCTGIADQLPEIGAWLGQPAGTFPPSRPERFAPYAAPERGVALRLHYPFWDRATTCDPDQWLIADVTFDPLRAPLPFDLEAEGETVESATVKLDPDRDDFPATRTSTFYLDDDRAVTIVFLEGGRGIETLRVTRLYGAVRCPPRSGSAVPGR
ncbi:hypothetical protein [Methylobacterium aquaticum]|uniref:Uncharacterized protein n=1 Tax=Methylobacterium aquaticum TaxID=270351 RepID=A0A0C6EYZ5_9HYPH|nr:hypothetical protein [Methylobacterium aquaticum]BAQ45491.1 hypothetical protein Maq22A_c11130 [Methylobacterium aquaticum]